MANIAEPSPSLYHPDQPNQTYPLLRGTQLMAGFIDFPFDFTHSFLWFACESKCSRAQLESRSVMVDCAIGSLLFALFVLEKPPKAPKKHTPHCFLCVGSQWATWFALFAILGFYAALIKCVFGWIGRDGDGSAMFAIRYCFYLNHRIGGRRSADGMKNERFSFASNVLVFFST